ncbi:outer membrane protein assembly factor BamB family protein [Natrinema salaciae]|uniref:Outer membrane protein assembly factor BamB, contains PQQ-like beta-propeller repeat n=1 Tax=Natrinema salaciae TaxID=1186196 RepID=A0A1H9AQM3_9EURY|nr:PQQ-binding-like beta-propeller repeat protein [Natrinema salaciae]SEP78959.1 Outer membrane protein assembly factor BamB, contains PQQ-like beta-propeller repeat [Natrinema salaciae]
MPPARRSLLTTVAATGSSVALAGCSALSSFRDPDPDEPPPAGGGTLSNPENSATGANGEWSTFGCNAANTRAVGDAAAPVDGLSERWRVEIAQSASRAPVVASGRVYQPDVDTLRVLTADDGSELWTLEDVREVPLVWNDVAYVSTGDAIRALEADTGDQLWERKFEMPGRVTTPATHGGERLVCGAGERVVALDTDDGTVRWDREVFGQVLDHPAVFMGHWFVVTTRAGMVYLLNGDGMGGKRWQLPVKPTAPPSADTSSVYVNCRNGTTYALMDDGISDPTRNWTADIGWAERGIAVADGLVLVANNRGLHAVGTESGDHYWEHDVGDGRHTAPAYGRDTVFVGGDRLHALDPTPGDSPEGGPAVRFEREFAGRVGPGPVLDDGTIYVVAQVDDETDALLALD